MRAGELEHDADDLAGNASHFGVHQLNTHLMTEAAVELLSLGRYL
jgi:hypothetical protein